MPKEINKNILQKATNAKNSRENCKIHNILMQNEFYLINRFYQEMLTKLMNTIHTYSSLLIYNKQPVLLIYI